MSWTERSVVLQPVSGLLTSRDSINSQNQRRKGLSLSKEHQKKTDQTRNKSPAFIKLTQKSKKPVVAPKR
ncbi:MAG: hypothetical protein KDD45_08450 [Bdellovibrionales bacterium]|nr:hypothetical protein [Bdellovibrionales bacterium]